MRFLLTFLLIVFCLQSFVVNASDWRKVDSKENKTIFSAPGLENWIPGVTVSVNDNDGGIAEWKCWRRFKLAKANACVSYQSMPGENFRYEKASDIPRNYNSFKKIEYRTEGQPFSAASTFGETNVILGRMTYPRKKHCFTHSSAWDSNSSVLFGWYCAAEGDTIDKNFVYKAIASLGIKAELKPLKSSEIKYDSSKKEIAPSISPSKSGDVETRLREAKELFTKDLITETEYEELKKNILGIK